MPSTFPVVAASPISGVTNVAQPKSIAASVVTWPTRFSHAVNHPQGLPPSRYDQWYIAPEVGIAEASSAMLITPASVNIVTIGHANAISAGPPLVSPCP